MYLGDSTVLQLEFMSYRMSIRATYSIRSAGLVSSPNRCDEKIIVFSPLSFRIRVNRSN